MPYTLPPTSRRGFLGGALALGAGLLLSPRLRAAAAKQDPDRFALLSDTHLDAQLTAVDREANMADHLRRVVEQVAGLAEMPAGVLVNGDLAHAIGAREDYAAFLALLAPLRAAGLPVHLSLGNHDQREHFWAALPPVAPPLVEHRQVAVIPAARASFFLLDSLLETNQIPGACGDVQLQWLAAALDAQADQPALVMVHHDPAIKDHPGGLTDSAALLAVLKPRRQVKALFYGHTHCWGVTADEGLHLVNLPSTAYVFAPGQPTGWVDLHLAADHALLELHTLDAEHAANHQQVKLAWR